MKRDISNLILSVRNTMKDFSTGEMTIEQAREEYSALETRYTALRDRIEPGVNTGCLESICYYHNIENYSILSALVSVSADHFNTLLYYGSKSLLEKIVTPLKEHIHDGPQSGISRIPPNTEKGLAHTIHCSLLKTTGEERIFFIALSSSAYFTESSFIYTSSILKKLLFGQSIYISSFSHFENVEKSIRDFTFLNCDREHAVIAHIFTFPRIVRTFSHMGTAAMLDASRSIADTLGSITRLPSEHFVLSIKDYLLLVKHRKNDPATALPQKPVFSYNNIVIPHTYQEYRLENETALFTLWPDALTDTSTAKRGQ
ncbi:MAG TPA: hypothetical protein PLT75_12530 [Spirochaetota bacterium]|nr:hypothetical protein [Spirochaetota bacterium]